MEKPDRKKPTKKKEKITFESIEEQNWSVLHLVVYKVDGQRRVLARGYIDGVIISGIDNNPMRISAELSTVSNAHNAHFHMKVGDTNSDRYRDDKMRLKYIKTILEDSKEHELNSRLLKSWSVGFYNVESAEISDSKDRVSGRTVVSESTYAISYSLDDVVAVVSHIFDLDSKYITFFDNGAKKKIRESTIKKTMSRVISKKRDYMKLEVIICSLLTYLRLLINKLPVMEEYISFGEQESGYVPGGEEEEGFKSPIKEDKSIYLLSGLVFILNRIKEYIDY